jgi:hypothetical protein
MLHAWRRFLPQLYGRFKRDFHAARSMNANSE